jgi:L-histidine Nalpha-methyltransferase
LGCLALVNGENLMPGCKPTRGRCAGIVILRKNEFCRSTKSSFSVSMDTVGTHQQALIKSVKKGLTAERKYLPSWLFYDASGSKLFEEIMTLPEYYLTRCETEILQRYGDAIAYTLREVSRTWNIVELGPGDGTKTEILLSAFVKSRVSVTYYPVDISTHALNRVGENVSKVLPSIRVEPVHAEYSAGFRSLKLDDAAPRLILFLGANIGNYEISDAALFLRSIGGLLRPGDRFIVGIDLMKSPSVIEKAYHDHRGVTTQFNKNLLVRLNRELQGNFEPEWFEHWPIYDAVTGACRSYLVSLRKQTVILKLINLVIQFKPWETIFTEISQKYSDDMIDELASVSGLTIERMLFDEKRYFSLVFFSGRSAN